MSEQEDAVRETLEQADQPLTASEIAAEADVNKSTCRSILTRMREAGEAERDEVGRWRLLTTVLPLERAHPPRSKIGEHDDAVRDAVWESDDGLTVSETALRVGLRRRVVENVLFRLEQQGRVVSSGRPKRFRQARGIRAA